MYTLEIFIFPYCITLYKKSSFSNKTSEFNPFISSEETVACTKVLGFPLMKYASNAKWK